jgi:titin
LVTFPAASGTTYRIKVDGHDADTGTINLHLSDVPPPPNDDFAHAFVLSGKNASRTGDTNAGATLEAGEATTVAGSTAGASVWYFWTAPDSGQVTIDTATSGFDTLLGVYTGNAVSALTEVASNDDGPVDNTSLVSFPVTASMVYRIRVDGFSGLTGTINLHLTLVTAPGAPTSVSATAGNGSATVSWTAPASDGGSAITGYNVTRFVGGIAQGTDSVGVVTQTTVSGLTNGTTYTFRVAAKNTIGTGAQSSDSNGVTPMAPATAPGAPTGVSATAGNGSATVSWTAPAADGGSAITAYDVTR